MTYHALTGYCWNQNGPFLQQDSVSHPTVFADTLCDNSWMYYTKPEYPALLAQRFSTPMQIY